jgi:hypothetical protein
MTEDETPTPIPAAMATGSEKAGAAAHAPMGVATTAAMSIAIPSRSMPGTEPFCAARWLTTM